MARTFNYKLLNMNPSWMETWLKIFYFLKNQFFFLVWGLVRGFLLADLSVSPFHPPNSDRSRRRFGWAVFISKCWCVADSLALQGTVRGRLSRGTECSRRTASYIYPDRKEVWSLRPGADMTFRAGPRLPGWIPESTWRSVAEKGTEEATFWWQKSSESEKKVKFLNFKWLFFYTPKLLGH